MNSVLLQKQPDCTILDVEIERSELSAYTPRPKHDFITDTCTLFLCFEQRE